MGGPIKIGSVTIDTIGQLKVGSSNVQAAYVGSVQVFPAAPSTIRYLNIESPSPYVDSDLYINSSLVAAGNQQSGSIIVSGSSSVSINQNSVSSSGLVGGYTLIVKNITDNTIVYNNTNNLTISSYTVVNSASFIATASKTYEITASAYDASFNYDADYIVGTYTFVDGQDLDTRTRIVTPNVGQNFAGSYLGWAQYNYWPTSSDAPIEGAPLTSSNRPYLIWGDDNTGTGLESVLIDVKRFKEVYPSEGNILVDFRSFWYSTTGSSPVVLDITAYSGSYMIYHGIPYGFTYAGTNPSYSIDSGNKYITAYNNGSVVTGSSDLEDPAVSATNTRGQRLATLSYSIIGKSGSINISDTTTPAV